MNEKLLNYLTEHGLITDEQAGDFRRQAQETRRSVRELIIESGALSEERVIEALSAVSRIPVVHLYENPIPMEIRQIMGPELLRKYTVIPFGYEDDDRTVKVAIADPVNMKGRDAVAASAKTRIKPYLATSSDILVAVDRYYGSEELQEAAQIYTQTTEEETSIEEQLLQDDINSSPVVVLVNSLVEQAVRQRSSDIHIEAEPDRVRVRTRIDGILYQTANYSLRLLPAIVARVKIISGLDISEKRKPQDGRFTAVVDRREYDIRVSTLPTVFGEKCVLRLAPKKALNRNKRELGFSESDMIKFNNMLKRPNGIVLVTGPTGSGKSTTLYAALSELNSEAVNIITVEDPVEANIEGINQVQVNTKANLTFANALRSILRQDPDIIMIGEIRDTETASIAVQASITGHLVVSTLHTNDTAGSITRLLDMGVESYLIADAVTGIIAQRLVRRLCPSCKKLRPVYDYEAEYMRIPRENWKKIQIGEPQGCQRCNGTGFYDRVAVFEVMEITPKIRSLISKRASSEELRQEAVSEGMRSIWENARDLVLEGVTTVSEMQRVSTGDFADDILKNQE